MLFTIAIFLLFGFILAWVAQMVSREEVSVGLGVGILVIAYIATTFTKVAVRDAEEAVRAAAPIGVLFGVLILGLTLLAKLNIKHAAIISVIYTVLLTLIGYGISAAINAK